MNSLNTARLLSITGLFISSMAITLDAEDIASDKGANDEPADGVALLKQVEQREA